MKRIEDAIYEIIKNRAQPADDDKAREAAASIREYLDHEHGLVDDKEGSRNIWGEIVKYD